MLEGWYCRSIANMQAESSSGGGGAPQLPENSRDDYSSDSTSEEEVEPNYRDKYLSLKKKLKYLVFENECFQDVLRTNQKKLLKVSRDRSFLLDRLLQYEKPESSTSDSDDTESSDDNFQRVENFKRKKVIPNPSQQVPPGSNTNPTKPNTVRRRRPPAPKKTPLNAAHIQQMGVMKAPPGIASACGDGHMTPEEVERHLQSRHSYLELLPERAPPTVPTEMFSNEPSLDSESNDVLENSPNVDWYD